MKLRPLLLTRSALCFLTCLGFPATGQTPPPPAPAPAPAGATSPPPVSTPAPAPAPVAAPVQSTPSLSSDYVCTPTCRAGYTCVQRRCVSICNPGCAAGEICTDQGQCVSACNPPCPYGQQCTAQAQCMTPPMATPNTQSSWANGAARLEPTRPSDSSTDALARERAASRAEFSGGRLVGEIVFGAALGSAAAYGTYVATCDEDFTKFCVGPYFAAIGANLVGTTVGVYGTGTVFGGDAGLGWTLLGELLPFSATAPFAGDNPGLAIGVALALAPVTGAIIFEVRSNAEATRLRSLNTPVAMPLIVPLPQGALGGLQGTF